MQNGILRHFGFAFKYCGQKKQKTDSHIAKSAI